jgi:TonB-dependent SusC/RagA subfamily outer membrane receptor
MKLRFVFVLLMTLITGGITSGQKSNKKIPISGIVVDNNNKPLPGAIILIDNVKTSTITNQSGAYKLKVKQSAKKIGIFTFTSGIAEVEINGRTTINFSMAGSGSEQKNNPSQIQKEEEVNVGYGTVKKDNLTTHVSKIDGNNNKYEAYNSIYDMIKGEIPGVQVSGKSIKLQGSDSFMAGTEPLYVIDGVPVSSIDDIRPKMVKSIEVLKGSSASIYGSRGANGVILINLIKAEKTK